MSRCPPTIDQDSIEMLGGCDVITNHGGSHDSAFSLKSFLVWCDPEQNYVQALERSISDKNPALRARLQAEGVQIKEIMALSGRAAAEAFNAPTQTDHGFVGSIPKNRSGSGWSNVPRILRKFVA